MQIKCATLYLNRTWKPQCLYGAIILVIHVAYEQSRQSWHSTIESPTHKELACKPVRPAFLTNHHSEELISGTFHPRYSRCHVISCHVMSFHLLVMIGIGIKLVSDDSDRNVISEFEVDIKIMMFA
jgi:hypothetical protein